MSQLFTYSIQDTLCQGLPSISDLKNRPELIKNLPKQCLELLHWIVTLYEDGIELNLIELGDIPNLPTYDETLKPNYVFEIVHDSQIYEFQQFQELKEKYGSTIGFHGSSFENFHSILRNGLDENFSKQSSLFGQGIYFAENLQVANSFKSSKPLQGSQLGSQASIIAVCEVINHPRYMKKGRDTSHVVFHDEEKVPEGYIVSTSRSIVLLKYVFVYTQLENVRKEKKKTVRGWLIVLIVYIVFLVSMYLIKSGRMRIFWNQED